MGVGCEELGGFGFGEERRELLGNGGGRGGAFLLKQVPWDGLGVGEVVAEVDGCFVFNWDNGVLESVDREEEGTWVGFGLVSGSGSFLFLEGVWVLGAIFDRQEYKQRRYTQELTD